MAQITLDPMAPSVCIYRGNKSCPRTLVLQQENLPGGGGNKFIEAIFFCSDKQRLDGAQVLTGNQITTPPGQLNGILSEGVAIGKTLHDFDASFPNIFTIVLEDVTVDIYVRAVYFDVTTQVFENEPFFLNFEVF